MEDISQIIQQTDAETNLQNILSNISKKIDEIKTRLENNSKEGDPNIKRVYSRTFSFSDEIQKKRESEHKDSLLKPKEGTNDTNWDDSINSLEEEKEEPSKTERGKMIPLKIDFSNIVSDRLSEVKSKEVDLPVSNNTPSFTANPFQFNVQPKSVENEITSITSTTKRMSIRREKRNSVILQNPIMAQKNKLILKNIFLNSKCDYDLFQRSKHLLPIKDTIFEFSGLQITLSVNIISDLGFQINTFLGSTAREATP